jgi:hypothetical protein
MNAAPNLLTMGELETMLEGSAESLCFHLFPNGKINGGFFEIGSIAGEPGRSLKVNLTVGKRGCWTDFSDKDAGLGAGSGDLLWLIAGARCGGNLKDACRYARAWLGVDNIDPATIGRIQAQARVNRERANVAADREAEKKRRKAIGLWSHAEKLPGTPAERYLHGRGLDLRLLGRAPGALRFRPDVWCSETGSKLPAMVAIVLDLEGRSIACHRTYLQRRGDGSWTKAQLEDAKKALGRFGGGFIPVWKGRHRCSLKDLPEGTPVYVTEGIEDALTVAIARPDLRVIAAISLGNIGAIELPAQAGPLVIVADRDKPGSKAVDALERAIAAQQRRGRRVQLVLPPEGAKDMNEALQRMERAA